MHIQLGLSNFHDVQKTKFIMTLYTLKSEWKFFS